ncbi:MAG: NADH-quinone oxidoreductase subunit N, partial [Chloroflexi bacterium]|nr:NADH-quinone oxidoreductase subunit N [Chloroflexota bacterium]
AILLYGLSLLYGTLGDTTFRGMSNVLFSGDVANPAFIAGLVLVIAGLAFKIAIVPFHMWVPDVYEGAPTPITAYLAVASKAAGFALVLRLFTSGLGPAVDDWQPVLAVLAAASMVVGNLVAIVQRNIKRMLAYSSIGQAGYLLLGVVAFSPDASSAVAFHIVGYAVTNLAAFICVIAVYNATGKEEIPDYAGLGDRAPFLALALSAALFSLAGLPFFAGFTTKFYLFTAAATEGYLWLVALAVTMSVVSLYYYLMVVKQMYIHQAEDKTALVSPLLTRGVLGLLVAGIILFGVYPQPLVRAITDATRALF